MFVSERVTVGMVNDIPKYLIWKGRSHNIIKVGLHHKYFKGKYLIHVFSVTTSTLFMKLELNTQNLIWNLLEVNENNQF